MRAPRRLHSLGRDASGGTLVEFALLAPLFFGLLLGVLGIGIQMRDYAAIRSLAAEINRYTVVEYQKNNYLSSTQIGEVATAMAMRAPFSLDGNRLDVTVSEADGPITGAREFTVDIDYEAAGALAFYKLKVPDLTYEEHIFVPDA